MKTETEIKEALQHFSWALAALLNDGAPDDEVQAVRMARDALCWVCDKKCDEFIELYAGVRTTAAAFKG